MQTFPYARVGDVVGHRPDGTIVTAQDVEVIDAKTGEAPINPRTGKPYYFTECSAREGWGWVFDEPRDRVEPTKRRIAGEFIIREVQPARADA